VLLSDSNDNTAVGTSALNAKSHGSHNTATGDRSLEVNTGSFNVGVGDSTLTENSSGEFNIAAGTYALSSNTTGPANTAVGYQALYENTTGGNNIALGNGAGGNLRTGSNNIDIGNPGAENDTDTIKIGVSGTQTATYMAGISTTRVTGAPVYVTAAGQLGVLASSERYKTDIATLKNSTEKLARLRPVSFHLKSEPSGLVQYGLIAEEVDKVFPELVIRDDKGEVQGVRYDELAPMLLNVMQQQQIMIESQSKHAASQDAAIRDLKREEQLKSAAQAAEIDQLKQQLADIRAALVQRVDSKNLVAQR